MPPKARGRHWRRKNLVKFCLCDSVYSLWKEKNDYRGFGYNTNDEFAGYLLHRNTAVAVIKRVRKSKVVKVSTYRQYK